MTWWTPGRERIWYLASDISWIDPHGEGDPYLRPRDSLSHPRIDYRVMFHTIGLHFSYELGSQPLPPTMVSFRCDTYIKFPFQLIYRLQCLNPLKIAGSCSRDSFHLTQRDPKPDKDTAYKRSGKITQANR